jgi:hypothetical protein
MITLDANSRDRLNRQLRLWKEELRVHGANGTGQSTMTQNDIDRLIASIDGLHRGIERLNQEYRRIVEL